MKQVLIIAFFLACLTTTAQPACSIGYGLNEYASYPLDGKSGIRFSVTGLTPCIIYNFCFPFNGPTDWIEIFQLPADSSGSINFKFDNDTSAHYLGYSHTWLASLTPLYAKVIQPYGLDSCGSQKIINKDICYCNYFSR